MSNKRFRILLTAVLLLSMVAAFAACTQEEVKIKSIAVKPDQQTEFALSDFSLSKIFIVVTDTNGNTFETSVSEGMLSADDLAKTKVAGEHEITVNYNGFSATLTLKLTDNGGNGGDNPPPAPTNIVTVEFNSNGGSKVESRSGEARVVIETEPKPTNGNLTFGGWYTDQKLSNRAEFPFTATMNVTLYAKWNSSTIKVSFAVNAPDVSPIPEYKIEMGSKITLPTNVVREGYDFVGWFEDQACAIAVAPDKVYNKDTTLYAGYRIRKYTVTFDLAGGKYYTFSNGKDNPPKDKVVVEYEYGATIKNLPIADRANHVEGYYRDDFVFRYWEMDGEQYSLDTMPARNITITATWNIKDPSTFFEYSENPDGTLTITGYAENVEKNATDITIPSVIGGKKVTAIGAGAFRGRSKLKSVSIPSGVKYIYDKAFEGTSLTGEHTSSIPTSIEYVGVGAFPDTWEYSTVTYPVNGVSYVLGGLVNNILVKYTTDVGYNVKIPDGITAISAEAFKNCQTIRQIEIGKDVVYIGENAFQNSKVNRVTFAADSKIKTIASSAFAGTDWETSEAAKGDNVVFGNLYFRNFDDASDEVTVPAGVKYINEKAFAANVKNIVFEDESAIEFIAPNSVSATRWATNRNVAIVNGILVYVKRTPASTTYVVPETVKAIAGKAFEEVKNSATNIVLPSSVKTVCDYAFAGFGAFNLTLKGNTPPQITTAAFAKSESDKNLVNVGIFVNDAAMVSFTEESRTNGWYSIRSRISAVVVSDIEKVEGLKSSYEIGEKIDLSKVVLTYRTNDNLVYTKVGLETKNIADFEELTLRAGDREMTVNYGLDGARGAEYIHRYRVFPSIKSVEVSNLESSYFIGDSLKSVSGKTAEIKVTYVTYRSADVNLETGEYTETLEPQSYHMFEDGNLFYRITAEGFSTATAGVFTMTLKYVEELTDDTGAVVHSLQSSIDFDYVVRERDIEKIELTGYKPDANGGYVFTNYTPSATGSYIIEFTYAKADDGEYMQAVDFVESMSGEYVVKGTEAADGGYVYDETAKVLVEYVPEVHGTEVKRYTVDLTAPNYEIYADGDIGLRFKRVVTDYVPYDGVSEVDRYNRTVGDHFVEYKDGMFGERYAYDAEGSYVTDDGSLWYKGLEHFSHDAFFGKTVFGILEELDLDNIYVKCTYNQPDESGSRVEYLPLRSFEITGFDTSVAASGLIATVTYGTTAISTEFGYSVEEYTAENVFDVEFVGEKAIVKGLGAGYPSIIYLPGTINGKAVEIADGAFKNLTGLDKVVIRAGLTLGNGIFEGSDVKEVLFDADGAYTKIPEATFRNTTALVTVTLPSSVIAIGAEAFKGSAIENFVVPDSVRTIALRAFEESKLVSLTLGAGVEYVGMSAFRNCNALTEIRINSAATELVLDKAAFSGCVSLGSVILPENVKNIPAMAFYGAVALREVTAYALNNVGKQAFDGCSALQRFTAESVGSVGKYAFRGAKELSALAFNFALLTKIEEGAFDGCKALDVDLSKMTSLGSIGEGAFRNTALTRLVLPGTVNSLGELAFEGCTELVYVDLSLTSLTSVSDGMFKGFTKLETVLLPTNLETVGKSAFKNTAIKNIVIPASVVTIGERAFEDCSALVSVEFGAAVETIGAYAFVRASSLAVVSLPASVRQIGVGAFEEAGVSTLSFAENGALETIGDRAFWRTAVQSVSIPKSVKTVGAESFADNQQLTSLVFAEGGMLESVGAGAFRNDENLSSVNWGKAAAEVSTVIGGRAFEGCASIVELTIPYTVSEIGQMAFYNLENLKKLVIGAELRDFYTVATNAQIGQAKNYLSGVSGATEIYIYEKDAAGNYVKITDVSAIDTVDKTKIYYVHSVEMAVQVDQTRSKLTKVGNSAFCNTFKLEELYITAENPKKFGDAETNVNCRQFGYLSIVDGQEKFVGHFEAKEDNSFKLHILITSEITGTNDDYNSYSAWINHNKSVIVQDIHFKFDPTATA